MPSVLLYSFCLSLCLHFTHFILSHNLKGASRSTREARTPSMFYANTWDCVFNPPDGANGTFNRLLHKAERGRIIDNSINRIFIQMSCWCE